VGDVLAQVDDLVAAADFADYCERAETRALGRALAALGIGTQFVGQDLTEGDHVADAPVRPPASSNDHAPEADVTAGTETLEAPEPPSPPLDWRDLFPQIRLPVLVCVGRQSKIFPWQGSAYVGKHIPGAKTVFFEHSGHMPFYEAPEKFNHVVRDFVLCVPKT
jgi:pimeloyl-ACP methyl ester carboxylesterase